MADRFELFGMIDDAQTVNLQYTINDVSTVGGIWEIPAHSHPLHSATFPEVMC